LVQIKAEGKKKKKHKEANIYIYIYIYSLTTRKLSFCDPLIATYRDNRCNVLLSMTFATVYAAVLKLSQYFVIKIGKHFSLPPL
jgi:hypothetical protein